MNRGNRPLLLTPEKVLSACGTGLLVRRAKTGHWVSDVFCRDRVLAGFGIDMRDYLDDDDGQAKWVIDLVHAEELRLLGDAREGHQ